MRVIEKGGRQTAVDSAADNAVVAETTAAVYALFSIVLSTSQISYLSQKQRGTGQHQYNNVQGLHTP